MLHMYPLVFWHIKEVKHEAMYALVFWHIIEVKHEARATEGQLCSIHPGSTEDAIQRYAFGSLV